MDYRRVSALPYMFAAMGATSLYFAQAQSPAPSFEVASVRATNEPGRAGTKPEMRVDPSGITFIDVNLMRIITEAYGVTKYQVKGPDWLRTEFYDIVARADDPASRSQLMEMLRTLLTDRFKLATHQESAEMRVLALVVDRRGPRLKPSAGASQEPPPRVDGGRAFINGSMADLASYLSSQGPIGVPVIDQTNLSGRFDFTFAIQYSQKLEADLSKAAFDGGPAPYRDALADLGLKLESRKLPVDILVIDHVEKIPPPN